MSKKGKKTDTMDCKEKFILISNYYIILNEFFRLNCDKKNKNRTKRKIWARKWLLRRNSGRDMTHFVINELQYEDPATFENFTRMKIKTFIKLFDKVKVFITKQDVVRESISPETRLLITLRFLATGETYTNLSLQFRVSVPAISVLVPQTAKIIYDNLKDEYLRMPQTEDEWKRIALEFEKQWNFPLCLGALDGKHIAIKGKKEYGSYFYNYKGFHSIVLLALVDANYQFLFVDIGTNGRVNDASIFNESLLCRGIKENSFRFPPDDILPGTNQKAPYVIVADEAFKLSTKVMKPYGNKAINENKIFNYRLSRARRVVENSFGILARKFQILQKEIALGVDKAEQITLTACALHNYIRKEDGVKIRAADKENTTEVTFTKGSWRETVFLTKLGKTQGNRSCDDAVNVRNTFQQYFNTTGFVPWQWEAIKKFNF